MEHTTMHREQTSRLRINGITVIVRYAVIYGHDEGWKLGKIYSVKVPFFGVPKEVIQDLTDEQLERIKAYVAEDIDRSNN